MILLSQTFNNKSQNNSVFFFVSQVSDVKLRKKNELLCNDEDKI